MTEPIEKPPRTVWPGVRPVRSQAASWKRASASKAAWKVSGSGNPTRGTTYQCWPGQPGRVSGARGVSTCRRRFGSRTSPSPSRSCSSAPRPWWRTRSPSGSPAAGRSRKTRSAIALRALSGPLGARVDDGSQRPLQPRAQVLVLGGQAQLLAETLGVLVGGEAGGERGDLEEHAARLAEVDRAEVVAVAHVGHRAARLADAPLPGQVVVVMGGPGDVVHRPGALAAVGLGRRVVGPVHVALLAVEAVLAGAEMREAQDLGEDPVLDRGEGRVGPGALDAEDRVLGGDLGMLRAQRRVAVGGDDELEGQAVGVGEAQRAGLARD